MSRGKNSFQESWKGIKDGNGDNLGEYILREDDYLVKCTWCRKSFSIDNQGKHQIFQHSKSTGHRNIANSLKGRNVSQTKFFTVSENNNNPPNQATPSIKNFLVPTLSGPVTLGNDGREKLSISDQVTKGETILLLKGVESQWSYASYDNIVEVLQKVDPDSKVISKMQLKKNKVRNQAMVRHNRTSTNSISKNITPVRK